MTESPNPAGKGEPVSLQWALRYAGMQWYVIPVGEDRRPLGGFGLSYATVDDAIIRGWWKTWPQAMVAVACKPSRLIVVDLDKGHVKGVDGTRTLRKASGGKPHGATLIARTPRGGEHLFYAANPNEIIGSNTGVLPGVDVKASGGQYGGYVVLPCGGEDRAWKKGDPFKSLRVEPPIWLMEILRQKSSRVCDPQPTITFSLRESDRCRIASALFAIPPNIGRSEWLRAIYSVHAACEGDGYGERMVEHWSSLTPYANQYKQGEATATYRKALKPQDLAGKQPVTARTLDAMAQKYRALQIFTDDSARVEPVSFPITALPRICRAMVEEGAKAQGVDVAFWAVPLLGILAGCVGATRNIELSADWQEPAILWTAIIAPSGSGKSPPLRALLVPVREHDRALHHKVRSLQKAHAIALEAWKRSGKKGLQKPEAPRLFAALVDDITLEALFSRLEDNPRGLLLAVDELAGWIRSFNRYRSGGGGDEQAWLSIHNTDPAKIDRKGSPGSPQRIYVPRAAVAVVGTIQPGIAKKYIGSSENLGSGLAARILLAKPPVTDARWTNAQTTAKTREHYRKVLLGLLQLQLTEKGDPRKLQLSEHAQALFIQFHDENGAACADAARSGDENMAAVLSKLRGAAARIALVLALSRAAEEGNAHDLVEIDAEAMSSGIDIVRYFESEARRLYAGWRHDAVSEPASAHATLTDKDIEERIVEMLQSGEKSRSDLSNAFGRNVSSERIGSVLELLKVLSAVDCRRETSGGRGRPKETWFLLEGGIAS